MKNRTLKEKWQYYVDNVMSKGTIALIGVLFGITLLVAVAAGIVSLIFGNADSVLGGVWNSLMHILDAGTLTADDPANLMNILVMTVVTLCGLFVTSILIGIITTGFEQKIRDLSKGKSVVLEEQHTVILGFNDNLYTLLNELIEANSNHKDRCIVVVGTEEKEVMEEAIHAHITDFKTTRIVCRSGLLHESYTLENCGLDRARSVLINVYDDFEAIKIILAVAAFLKDHEPLVKDLYMTVSIRDKQNVEAAKIAGEGRVEVLHASDAISRIIAHTCRQPGLSNALVELFDFGGDELYFEKIPAFTGKTFGEVLGKLPKAVAFGLRSGGQVLLNPPMDRVIGAEDDVILLEGDDGAYTVSDGPTVPEALLCNAAADHTHENGDLLILGANAMLDSILDEYSRYVAAGTVVTIVCQRELELDTGKYPGVQVRQMFRPETDRALLEEQVGDGRKDVLILSDTEADPETSDSKTLLQLIFLREIAQRRNLHFTTTCEMCKSTNQRLAKRAQVDDFVIGTNIINLIMTQVAENRDLAALFADILDEDGSEIYMKPASQYVAADTPVDFYAVTESARRKGQIAIGYKLVREGKSRLVTNPLKSDSVTFTAGDSVIVISED